METATEVVDTSTVDSAAGAPESRDRWSHRVTFILAAIASAVGIGNLWRFPSLSFNFGGGAFFIPYLAALFLVGIPILILEFSVGQIFQGGGLKAFGSVHPRFRGVGLAAATTAFFIVLYYSTLLGWGVRYVYESFFYPAGWSFNVSAIASCAATSVADCSLNADCTINAGNLCGADFTSKARSFLFDTVLQNDSTVTNLSFVPTSVAGLAIIWLLIYLAIFKGVLSTGMVVWVTMFVPFGIIIFLAIYGVTLQGAQEGIRQYIGVWDVNVLTARPDIYSSAVGQIFFSIGVTYGIMPAYASYNKKKQNVFVDALIVSISNSLVSLMAGFAVFSVVGYLAATTQTDSTQFQTLNIGGPLLVFVAYPVALSTLPQVLSRVLSVLFFITFVFLGVDSAFSMVESFGTVLYDSPLIKRIRINGNKIPRWLFVLGTCVVCFLLCFMYCTRIGFTLLDVVDNYINNVAALLIGCLECVAVSWVYGKDRVEGRVGSKPLMISAVSWFGGAFFAIFFTFIFPVNLVFSLVIGIGIMLGGTAYSVYIVELYREGARYTISEKMYDVLLGTAEEFRKDVNRVTTDNPNKGIPLAWSIVTKYFIPVALMTILLFSLGPNGTFGRYQNLNIELQSVGFMFALIDIAMIVIGLISPEAYDFLYPVDEAEEEVYTKASSKVAKKLSVQA